WREGSEPAGPFSFSDVCAIKVGQMSDEKRWMGTRSLLRIAVNGMAKGVQAGEPKVVEDRMLQRTTCSEICDVFDEQVPQGVLRRADKNVVLQALRFAGEAIVQQRMDERSKGNMA